MRIRVFADRAWLTLVVGRLEFGIGWLGMEEPLALFQFVLLWCRSVASVTVFQIQFLGFAVFLDYNQW